MKTRIEPQFNEDDDDVIMEDGTKDSDPSKIKDKYKAPNKENPTVDKENTIVPPKPI
jgi:hypothetical protein